MKHDKVLFIVYKVHAGLD